MSAALLEEVIFMKSRGTPGVKDGQRNHRISLCRGRNITCGMQVSQVASEHERINTMPKLMGVGQESNELMPRKLVPSKPLISRNRISNTNRCGRKAVSF